MDFKFNKRKTGKDKARKTRELYGDHSAKHVRIQEQCQENHKKNIQQSRIDKNTNDPLVNGAEKEKEKEKEKGKRKRKERK
jgi:hypothetical protein